jgi:hypothetical protein
MRKNGQAVMVAQQGKWRLYLRAAKDADDWSSFKLEARPSPRHKANWWLGCNGERLARNRDAQLLAKHEAAGYAWAEAECMKAWRDARAFQK